MKAALDCSQVYYISFITLGLEEKPWCYIMHVSLTPEALSHHSPVECSLTYSAAM